MGYYDSIKDDVKGNDKGSSDTGGASFDTLKEKAEDSSEDEKKGDSTPIEVLEDGGLDRRSSSSQSSTNANQQVQRQTGGSTAPGSEADLSSVEDKLDKIIEQNQRMIEVLESFGS